MRKAGEAGLQGGKLKALAAKTRCFDGGYLMGGRRFEQRVNDFLASREIERVLLSTYSRTAQGMNLLDYRLLVRYLDALPIRRQLQVRVLEEGYEGSVIHERVDRAVGEMAEEVPDVELVEIQSALYEVEPPGRGMGGKDFVQLAVYLLVFALSVQRGPEKEVLVG